MKLAPFAALGLALAAATAPVAASAQEAPAAAPAATLSIDTPIAALVADARAKAVLDKHLPGIDQHPAFEQFKGMSLKVLAPYSQGMITDDLLAKIGADLAAIK
ncbi:hypothetical protein [Erythrobacter neustonensis]|uniref:Uncharacterized protein n=1 Tax=Erythrobacter neustonensis TaxID=1112 RepID=A0A192D3H2_9SPHN|nr:hypothetical protein [Erythrobacter neustonensis]ANK12304.1 hypothetical protein A9D12_04355 [Erythrobacter neustonensis]